MSKKLKSSSTRGGVGKVKLHGHIKISDGPKEEPKTKVLEAAAQWIENDFPGEFAVRHYDDGIIQVGIYEDNEEHLLNILNSIWSAFERAGYKVVDVPCESMESTHN